MTQPILVPVSAGELFDKISILQIKMARIGDAAKRAHASHEHALLSQVAAPLQAQAGAGLAPLTQELRGINETLWDLENTVRAFDRAQDFGADFVASARRIYAGNDQRARVKLAINQLLGSDIVEAKEHGGPALGRP